jgi:hypothetical protein
MMVNVNARLCTDGSVYVQYQEDGKARDAALPDWQAFTTWMERKVHVRTGTEKSNNSAGHGDSGGPGF